MVKIRTTTFLFLITILTACTIFGTNTPTGTSGIDGYVTIGPVCPGPVSDSDVACQDQPYQAKITVLDENNKQITTFTTDSNGYFKISLNPGNYILHPEQGEPFPVASDQPVSVTENMFTEISIQYDTGMR